MATQSFKIGAFSIRVEVAEDRVKFFAEGPQGAGRFLEIVDGGGHLELNAPGSIPTGTGLELDEASHAVFRLA